MTPIPPEVLQSLVQTVIFAAIGGSILFAITSELIKLMVRYFWKKSVDTEYLTVESFQRICAERQNACGSCRSTEIDSLIKSINSLNKTNTVLKKFLFRFASKNQVDVKDLEELIE